ncbi:hypothetical protein [Pseudolysinimonas yzui]|uniref:Uncharacterized protein n=1 Tax=Pseudolysinimonas yzui TaxID=2708254 RepID=A0A8J3M1Q7_9MICO|nr:hypothetical protein [Pseudolysinimonas yzui]GHF14924.1 hypothetical protein GCM10011600_14870 [Pseudolysinimonas yzui]
MRIRSLAVTGLLAGALLLTGCGPATPEPSGTSSDPAATPDATPTEGALVPAELVLPDDALLGLVGILTAPNGATADLAVIVHASLPHMVPEAADAVAATAAWCAGEVDESVISGRGFTFTFVDVTVTPRDGDWPDDLSLLVLPVANPELGSTIVAGAGLRQVEEATDEVFADYVPHCQQPAVLDGAGAGTLYLGIPQDIAGANDNASFTAWALHDFGMTAVLPGDLGASDVEFSMCESEVTLLGEEFGAVIESWAEGFSSAGCFVGGAS